MNHILCLILRKPPFSALEDILIRIVAVDVVISSYYTIIYMATYYWFIPFDFSRMC